MNKELLTFLLAVLVTACNSPVQGRPVNAVSPAQPDSTSPETGPELRARIKALINESIGRFKVGQKSIGLDELAGKDNELADAIKHGLVSSMGWEARGVPLSNAGVTWRKYPPLQAGGATEASSVIEWVARGMLEKGGMVEIALIENSSPVEGKGPYELLVVRDGDDTYVVPMPLIEAAISASMAGVPSLDGKLAAENVLSAINATPFRIPQNP